MTSTGKTEPRRSSSTEEGPSIYKFDQLLRMLETVSRDQTRFHPDTDLLKLLSSSLTVRTEANGSSRRKGEDVEKYKATRLHSFCRQLADSLDLEKDDVVERIIHMLLHDESQLHDLCEHLTAASDNYQQAMSVIKDQPWSRPVTIRIGTTNLINMRILPTVLEDVRKEFRKQFPDIQLRFTQTILDSADLVYGSRTLAGIDLIVACCLDGRLSQIPKSELLASLPLRCCLLRQRTEEAGNPRRSLNFSTWSDLRGPHMIALTSRRNYFDMPWLDIESSLESIEEVPTLLEAHARVAASDAWTFSYRELMDDVEELRLEAFDPPKDSQRQTPWIVAFLPLRKRKTGRSFSETGKSVNVEKQTALELLKSQLQCAFERKQENRREAEEMSRWLSRFPYSYHVSDFAPKGSSEIQRTWFAGHANLEFTSNGNLSGVFTLGNPVKSLRVFGRPIPHHNRTVWHLQWRSYDQRAESGTTNLVISRTDLKEGQALVGSWMGRSSWTADDVRPAGGPFILHTQSGLTTRELRQIVLAHQNQCVPDLRQLSNQIITIPIVDSAPNARSSSNGRKRLKKPR